MSKVSKILMIGYSGWGNFGDDLLLHLAYQNLGLSNHDISILTTNQPKKSAYLEKLFPHCKILQSEKKILVSEETLLRFDIIFFFGGGLFFDYSKDYTLISALRRIKYYGKNYLKNSFLGKVKFIGIGLGFGPFKDWKTLFALSPFILSFNHLNVRDTRSFQNIKKYTLPWRRDLSEDLSFACLSESDLIQNFDKKPNRIIICLRNYKYGSAQNNYLENILVFARYLKGEFDKEVCFYSFQSEYDKIVMDQIPTDFKSIVWDPLNMNFADVFQDFGEADLVITSRMHGLYISGFVRTKAIGIAVHPKLEYAAKLFDPQMICLSAFPTLEELKNAFHSLSNRDISYTSMSKILEETEQKVINTYKKAREIIES